MNRNPSLPVPRRPLRSRFGALLWALLFLMGATGEGYGLHPCPHHGAGAESAAAHADVSHEAAHAGHAHADVPATTAVAESTDSSRHPVDVPHSGPCTCGSACQGAGGATLSAPATEALAALSIAAPEAPIAVCERRPASPLPHLLPFAQAPPRLG